MYKLLGFWCVCVPTEQCIKESLLHSILILSGISHKNSLLSFTSFVSAPPDGVMDQGERLDFHHPARLLISVLKKKITFFSAFLFLCMKHGHMPPTPKEVPGVELLGCVSRLLWMCRAQSDILQALEG